MATKYLARTVIEGGRDRRNSYERRYSNRVVRRATRNYLHRVEFDSELPESEPPPMRDPMPVWHHDRLAAAERWLASHLGEPWDQVRAEISRRFDVRTLAGQHVVYDHLLASVLDGECHHPGHYDFCVDADGLLQRGPRWYERMRWRQHRKLPPGKVRRFESELRAWSAGRRVGGRGRFLYWYEPTAARPGEGPFYRQTRAFTASELTYWRTIPQELQVTLLKP